MGRGSEKMSNQAPGKIWVDQQIKSAQSGFELHRLSGSNPSGFWQCLNVFCANPCCHCGTSGWSSGLCCPCASCNLAGCEDVCCCMIGCANPLIPLMAIKWGISTDKEWEIAKKIGGPRMEVCAFCSAGCCCLPCIWCADAAGKLGDSQGFVKEALRYARTRDYAYKMRDDEKC